jgi:hypothetical protein
MSLGMETSLGKLTWENVDGEWTPRIAYETPKAEPLPIEEFRKVWMMDRYFNRRMDFNILDLTSFSQVAMDNRRFL